MLDRRQRRFERLMHQTPTSMPDDAWTFVGDSHIERVPWHEVFPARTVFNRGVSGATLTDVVQFAPRVRGGTVWLMAGINDIRHGRDQASMEVDIRALLDGWRDTTKVVLHAVVRTALKPPINKRVDAFNEFLSAEAKTRGLTLIDLNPVFAPDGELAIAMRDDAIHLSLEAERAWVAAIRSAAAGQATTSRK